MITGHEVSTSGKFAIRDNHQDKYSFIKENPDIFPGFFHMDLQNNILPKLAIMRKFGFYPLETTPNNRIMWRPFAASGRHEIATSSIV
jgi:hypothetical protein